MTIDLPAPPAMDSHFRDTDSCTVDSDILSAGLDTLRSSSFEWTPGTLAFLIRNIAGRLRPDIGPIPVVVTHVEVHDTGESIRWAHRSPGKVGTGVHSQDPHRPISRTASQVMIPVVSD